jgi:hypothetical protein
VRLLAADAIDSLPADLLKKLPGVAAQAAALRLPLDVAAALGDTEEERAAAYVLASQSASLEAANAQLAAAAAQTPQELARAREALARAPAQSPSDAAPYAAREREADAALRAAMTTTAFRLAQARQLTVRKILFSRFDALVRDAGVSDAFARLFSGQRLEEFKLAQAESAARFALRHNGQNRRQGATRALAAAITALRAERALPARPGERTDQAFGEQRDVEPQVRGGSLRHLLGRGEQVEQQGRKSGVHERAGDALVPRAEAPRSAAVREHDQPRGLVRNGEVALEGEVPSPDDRGVR